MSSGRFEAPPRNSSHVCALAAPPPFQKKRGASIRMHFHVQTSTHVLGVAASGGSISY
jgi:hypothetical protein